MRIRMKDRIPLVRSNHNKKRIRWASKSPAVFLRNFFLDRVTAGFQSKTCIIVQKLTAILTWPEHHFGRNFNKSGKIFLKIVAKMKNLCHNRNNRRGKFDERFLLYSYFTPAIMLNPWIFSRAR